MRHLAWIFSLLAAFTAASCRDRQQRLQEISFDIYLNINEPSYFDLTVPTGWVYFNGNTVNLIIYRNSTEEFTALDARSTYNIEDECMVEVMDDNTIIEDPCSGSQWLIMDGSIVSGPANFPLLVYETSFNSTTGALHIYN